ncbi:MAG: orotidine-5'-phosphate decarboxylase [Synechococcaceae cyanobacterium RM1_1_27]|nr:orotidine-5'-phosphate decarboxylase [Synechococcaceae cyanobacterium RM1_1_27]
MRETVPLKAAEAVIIALDLPTAAQALALVDRLPDVVWWKVGLELYTAAGPAVITALKARGKRVFLDLKLHDIPSVVARACGTIATYGVDLLTLHASGGSDMLKTSATAVQGSDCQLLAVTLLTSLSPEQVRSQLQIAEPVIDHALHLAQLAQSCGIPGAVCSGQEVAALRKACGSDLLLVTPGIRDPELDQVGDQNRVLSPAQAIQMGSNYLVIGRPITQAVDPAATFARFCQQVSLARPSLGH